MHEALAYAHIIINWLTIHWGTILALIGGGTTISAVLEVILTKWKIDSKKLAYFLVHFLSFAAGMVAYLVANDNAIAAYGGLVIMAQTVHRFFLSDLYNKTIVPFLNWKASQSATQAALQPATEPANPFAGQE